MFPRDQELQLSDEELRARIQAAIKAGTLPMPGTKWGGEIGISYICDPKTPIRCAACDGYMYARDTPYRLTSFPSQPEMHYPECVTAWHSAARDVWANAFDGEDFNMGDQRTGEGCLIWASLPPKTRVRFFVNRSVLTSVLGCKSALAGDAALACCREKRPSIEAACRQAFGERPGEFIELQESDFW